MPRRPRNSQAGFVYHALNRAAGRATLFREDEDYAAFPRALRAAKEEVPTRLLAYCLMPTHFHLVLRPRADREMSAFMHRLTVTHTMRWHAHHHTAGTGPLYQGRFKSFPVQEDEHLLTVIRYVERNPLRAGLVERAQDWPWSSLAGRTKRGDGLTDEGPLPLPRRWRRWINRPEKEAQLESMRRAVSRRCPYGSADWQCSTAERLGLQSTLRPRGRPKKPRT